MPFSSCSPSATSKPTHASNASCAALFHPSPTFVVPKKSGMKTSHSSNAGVRMRVSKMRSTNPTGDDGGKARLSAYRDAPPIIKPRDTGRGSAFILVIAASKLPSKRADSLGRFRYSPSVTKMANVHAVACVSTDYDVDAISEGPEFCRDTFPGVSTHDHRV